MNLNQENLNNYQKFHIQDKLIKYLNCLQYFHKINNFFWSVLLVCIIWIILGV